MDARKVVHQRVTMTIHIKHFREMQARLWLARLLCKFVAWIGGFKIEVR